MGDNIGVANTANTQNMHSSTVTDMVCPVCGKQFTDIVNYAVHVNEHSEAEKKRRVEEEKRRKADQKRADDARMEKLKKIYEDASNNYIKAKEKYYEDYGESYDERHDLFEDFNRLFDPWLRNGW